MGDVFTPAFQIDAAKFRKTERSSHKAQIKVKIVSSDGDDVLCKGNGPHYEVFLPGGAIHGQKARSGMAGAGRGSAFLRMSETSRLSDKVDQTGSRTSWFSV
ncbi:hypothetical protein [Streptosporangium amethystogenes]|uniref:hypothetical protein n=1 Tax=Streptosporangium amethystogenes TaxID=2002 RepID=UPI0012FAED39|nr:hypothetical protein [Streptosporangium amethystogenes]